MIELLTPDFTFSDNRGELTQLVNHGFSQVNVVESTPGSARGGHYHVENREAFFVVEGSFTLTVRKGNTCKKFPFTKGAMFLIPPLILHDFAFHEKTILVSMYDIGVENVNGKKDIYNLSIICNMLDTLIERGCTPIDIDFISWKRNAIYCLEVLYGTDSPEYISFAAETFEPESVKITEKHDEVLKNYCNQRLISIRKQFHTYQATP